MMIKPRALRPGATIGLTAPSGALRPPQTLEPGIRKLESLGYRIVRGKTCDSAYGYLAGNDALRADELNAMFADPAIDAIWCVRGGYGTIRILDRLDFDLARKNPKPLIGYSDITCLHTAYRQHSGLVTFHGPMLTASPEHDFCDALSFQRLMDMLCQAAPPETLCPTCPPLASQGGRASGKIIGGNLSLLAAACGTPYAPDAKDAILFIEEIGEKTYSVDRMLSQLRLSGMLDACAGIVLGGFTDCVAEYPEYALSLEQIFADILLPAGKPLLSGFSCGHCTPNFPIPLGVECLLDADASCLTFLESAVEP
ncbi:MAG TPA: LD-carboxypeptidase [Clostridia bacterium]|nr:LD-carboxypeptidase [Clostridia bacterium]